MPTGRSSPHSAKTALLEDLRARVRRIEGIGGGAGGVVPLGVPAIDAALADGGLPTGCLHELAGEPGGATAFAAALLARIARQLGGPALWIVHGRDLHAAGLAAYGLTPDRLIAVRAADPVDRLWAMEEALRCRRLSAVLAEVGALDATAGRRLQLAAEAGGVTGLALYHGGRRPGRATSAVTRWRVDSVPGAPADGVPGIGPARWRVELARSRGGRPGVWTVEWRDGGFAGGEPQRAGQDRDVFADVA